MNIFRRLTPYCGGLAIFLGTMFFGIAGFMSANASDVVLMTCAYRGHGLEVTQYDDSGTPNAGDLVKGTSCAETVEQLVDGNYSISQGGTGPKGLAAFAFLGVAPVLNPGELKTLASVDGKGCSCGDAVPIGGFDCKSCWLRGPPGGTANLCVCAFEASTPNP